MRYATLIFLLALPAAAQIPDGITTTVTRTVSIPPDEADFIVGVTTSLDVTQDQVVQAFHDAGIQNLNVVGVAAGSSGYIYSSPSAPMPAGQLVYQVTFTVAPAALAAYGQKLDAMNAKAPTGFVAVQYSAALSASQSVIDAAHQTALPQLLTDAKTKAQALAAASGLKLGPITGITESSSGAVGAPYVGIITGFAGYLGSFSSTNGSAGTQYTFYATVKFAAQ